MKIIPVIADTWEMDGGVAFGVVPRSIWEKFYPVDDLNRIPVVSRCLLIDNGPRRVLIETGMGRKQSERYYEVRGVGLVETLVGGLKTAGYDPADITDVVFTHLHDDHVGGAVYFDNEGEPQLRFPNAAHWCSASQWKWAMEPNKREAASYLAANLDPLKPIINLIEKPGLFTEGLRFEIRNGHTLGQLIPFITDGDKTLVYMADFIPSHAHIHIPFIASVDIQPLVAMDEKQYFLELASENKYVLIYEHDSQMCASTVELTDKGFRAGNEVDLSKYA